MNDNTKVKQENRFLGTHLINLSCVGKLIREKPLKALQRPRLQDDTRIILKSKKLKCGKASIYPDRDMEGKNTSNLKRGGRKALERTNLTSYAKRRIQDAGDMLAWSVANDSKCMSPIMITLTYGKAVPSDLISKRHINLFFNQCRKNNWLSTYLWVAQLQTGKRAKEKGQYSYRAEHGSAIHFHIITMTERGSDLQVNNAQKQLRAIWKKIVNDWERKSGHEVQNIGGVDVSAIYNASKYVSRYIKNETETIKGNMWGMSAMMRELIQPEESYTSVPKVVFQEICRKVDAKKMFRTNALGQSERIKIASGNTIAFRNWDNTYILLTNDYQIIESEFNRYAKNFGFTLTKWTNDDKERELWINEIAKIAKRNIFRKYRHKDFALQDVNLPITDLKLKPVPKPVPKPVQTIILI